MNISYKCSGGMSGGSSSGGSGGGGFSGSSSSGGFSGSSSSGSSSGNTSTTTSYSCIFQSQHYDRRQPGVITLGEGYCKIDNMPLFSPFGPNWSGEAMLVQRHSLHIDNSRTVTIYHIENPLNRLNPSFTMSIILAPNPFEPNATQAIGGCLWTGTSGVIRFDIIRGDMSGGSSSGGSSGGGGGTGSGSSGGGGGTIATYLCNWADKLNMRQDGKINFFNQACNVENIMLAQKPFAWSGQGSLVKDNSLQIGGNNTKIYYVENNRGSSPEFQIALMVMARPFAADKEVLTGHVWTNASGVRHSNIIDR